MEKKINIKKRRFYNKTFFSCYKKLLRFYEKLDKKLQNFNENSIISFEGK